MIEFLSRPWPWYVVGPIIGLTVPLLLLVGNKLLGISSNLRHICSATLPCRAEFFRYDWKRIGGWNLTFAAGIITGGIIGAFVLSSGEPVAIASQTRADLAALGIQDFSGLVPADIFSWSAVPTVSGLAILVLGGFLIGFGTAYGGGCTSGHGISGLADLQLPSLIAMIGIFAGGILTTFFILPLLL